VPFYRHYPRLAPENYLGSRTYFITVCCDARRPVFADISLGRETLSLLSESAAKHCFSLHAFCLMPDHLHVVIAGESQTSDLLKFVALFKQRTAFQYRRANPHRLWQTRFYDHILRRSDSIEDVACYIWMNPVRKGICTDPHRYPLSGSLTIEWMSRASVSTAWLPPWKTTGPD
jgi:putative transposase